MPLNRILEIACFNIESALIAQSSSADRIELCSNYKEGGITPLHQIISEARNQIQIPIHVIIRPRGGSFIYSENEIEEMKKEILFCKEQKINGIVFGVLNEEKEINAEACKLLIELAKPMSVTFHRAIDECVNIDKAVLDLIDLGVDRILTSGGGKNVTDGLSELKRLQLVYGKKIVIMPGGGIRSANIKEILKSGCKEFHSSALTGQSEIANAAEIERLKQFLAFPI